MLTRKFEQDDIVVNDKAKRGAKVYLHRNVQNTYAPVVELTTVRVSLSIAVQSFFHQMDVATAFLHGEMDKELYVWPPGVSGCVKMEGFCSCRKNCMG